MAASVKMSEGGDESSSEDEDLERFREAVWNCDYGVTYDRKGVGEINGKQSRRVTVPHHEHDGNQLQTTPEFRIHVAKKLGNLLDSCILEVLPGASICAEASAVDDKGDTNEGFRLFTSSVPGQSMDEPPAPARRRPIPSSSESDCEMEMRFKEAAVSISDLLPLHMPSDPSSLLTETLCSEKKKRKKKKNQKEKEVEDSFVPRKTKKQALIEANMELDSHDNFQSKDENENLNVYCIQVNNKRKKKNKKQVTEELERP